MSDILITLPPALTAVTVTLPDGASFPVEGQGAMPPIVVQLPGKGEKGDPGDTADLGPLTARVDALESTSLLAELYGSHTGDVLNISQGYFDLGPVQSVTDNFFGRSYTEAADPNNLQPGEYALGNFFQPMRVRSPDSGFVFEPVRVTHVKQTMDRLADVEGRAADLRNTLLNHQDDLIGLHADKADRTELEMPAHGDYAAAPLRGRLEALQDRKVEAADLLPDVSFAVLFRNLLSQGDPS